MFEFKQPAGDSKNDPLAKPTLYGRPLCYDPELVTDLLARHRVLECKVKGLAQIFIDDSEAGVLAARDCANELHELRRWEAIRLYPFVSRGLLGDPVAQRQWIVLRFVVSGLAHRVLRSIEDLSALRPDIAAAVADVAKNLAEYRERNEMDLYPLYNLMDPRRVAISA